MFVANALSTGDLRTLMRYRCSICGRETDESTETTRHISREHGRANFGWHMERVAETHFERVGVWIANLPVRVRYRYFERREGLPVDSLDG